MKQYELDKLLNNKEIVEKKIREFEEKSIITKFSSKSDVLGHLAKAQHDLEFARDQQQKYYDWVITGCYYACYHAALALIMTKGYYSKNHIATLCILIKEFYKKALTKEDIETLSRFMDYEDILFYVESKNKREDATYSSKTKFGKEEVEALRVKAVLFVSKIKSISDEGK